MKRTILLLSLFALAPLVAARAEDPATRSPAADETHAESAEVAEAESRAENAESAETADAGWTPLLLQVGWPSGDFDESSLKDVYGLSLGLFTAAADDVVGAQLSLGLPAARGTVWGVQAGLFGAISERRANGVQVGGVFAGSERGSGICAAGLLAVDERLDGVCIGGLMAGADRLEGVALAGLLASAGTGHGIVAALGFTSTGNALALANAPSEPFTGIQIAGIGNFGMDVRGVQLAPIFNVANELHGVQIGFVNRAFSGCGVQIGLFNLFGRDDDEFLFPVVNARF
jgi:hypothetical protein